MLAGLVVVGEGGRLAGECTYSFLNILAVLNGVYLAWKLWESNVVL